MILFESLLIFVGDQKRLSTLVDCSSNTFLTWALGVILLLIGSLGSLMEFHSRYARVSTQQSLSGTPCRLTEFFFCVVPFSLESFLQLPVASASFPELKYLLHQFGEKSVFCFFALFARMCFQTKIEIILGFTLFISFLTGISVLCCPLMSDDRWLCFFFHIFCSIS